MTPHNNAVTGPPDPSDIENYNGGKISKSKIHPLNESKESSAQSEEDSNKPLTELKPN